MEGRGVAAPALLHALIHRSAWNSNSANFAFYDSAKQPRFLILNPPLQRRACSVRNRQGPEMHSKANRKTIPTKRF